MPTLTSRIGFMQGRLSPQVGDRIQAFPRDHWREEFPIAERLGFPLMEWTLDYEGMRDNPLLTRAGRDEIARRAAAHRLRVAALTGDALMQMPFWKVGSERDRLVALFDTVLDACAAAKIGVIVVPLVDNGSIASADQARILGEVLRARAARLQRDGLVIAFESDFAPDPLARFIADYQSSSFGIAYDTGNSAALGYDWREEFAAYRARIVHVHVKDRLRAGASVPLGRSGADIGAALANLEGGGYRGTYVLQTARAPDGDHAGVLASYRATTLAWLGAVT